MNTYIAFYGAKQIEVKAATSYAAQQAAAAMLKVAPSKRYLVTVMLAAKDGVPVVHSTTEIG